MDRSHTHAHTHRPPGYGTANQQRPSRVWALDLDFTLTHTRTHKYAQKRAHQSLTYAAHQWACAGQRLNQLVLYSHVTINIPTPNPDLRAFPSNKTTLTFKCNFLSVGVLSVQRACAMFSSGTAVKNRVRFLSLSYTFRKVQTELLMMLSLMDGSEAGQVSAPSSGQIKSKWTEAGHVGCRGGSPNLSKTSRLSVNIRYPFPTDKMPMTVTTGLCLTAEPIFSSEPILPQHFTFKFFCIYIQHKDY